MAMRSLEESQESDYTENGHEESGGVGGVACEGEVEDGVRRRLMSLMSGARAACSAQYISRERTRTLSADCEMVEKTHK